MENTQTTQAPEALRYQYSTEHSRNELRDNISKIEKYQAIVSQVSQEARQFIHKIEKSIGIETAIDLTLILQCMKEEEEAQFAELKNLKYIEIDGIMTNISYMVQSQFN